jgi:hypothetical protein
MVILLHIEDISLVNVQTLVYYQNSATTKKKKKIIIIINLTDLLLINLYNNVFINFLLLH